MFSADELKLRKLAIKEMVDGGAPSASVLEALVEFYQHVLFQIGFDDSLKRTEIIDIAREALSHD